MLQNLRMLTPTLWGTIHLATYSSTRNQILIYHTHTTRPRKMTRITLRRVFVAPILMLIVMITITPMQRKNPTSSRSTSPKRLLLMFHSQTGLKETNLGIKAPNVRDRGYTIMSPTPAASNFNIWFQLHDFFYHTKR